MRSRQRGAYKEPKTRGKQGARRDGQLRRGRRAAIGEGGRSLRGDMEIWGDEEWAESSLQGILETSKKKWGDEDVA